MNRILFEPDEIRAGVAVFGGARACHVLDVLHGEVGQTLKTGEVDGLIGSAEIVKIDAGAERVVTVRVTHDRAAEPSWCDLILAPPRPRVMKRLLPQLAALGVGRLVLVGAEKVEKDFWGATLLKEENWRPLAIEGLMQAGTTELPRLECHKSFRRWLRDALEREFPASRRLVAHPYGARHGQDARATEGRHGQDALVARASCPCLEPRPLFAVGPEGGWTEEEVALLESHGFARVSLGPRILRTDTALVALLARFLPDA